jgi:Dolichyl-phosphate-mannose-protein mannosyltransferase
MLVVVLTLVPPLVTGWLAARWACPTPPGLATTLLRLCVGVGLALGFTSATYFLWLVAAGPPTAAFLLTELTVFALLIALLAGHGQAKPAPLLAVSPHHWPRRLGVVLLVVFGCAAIVALVQAWRSPHGEIDAWAIWNLRARFLYRGGNFWREGFTSLLPWSHPDYPLLLPANVARCWTYAGDETTVAPRLLALLFGAATVGLLIAGVALLRTPSQGCLAGIVLQATPAFVALTTKQCADVPLGFYILASVVLFELHDRLDAREFRLVLLAGLLTGMAAWTKNEGQLFLVATLVGRGVTTLHAGRGWCDRLGEWLAVVAGLTPFLGLLIYFKLCLAPSNDLVEGQSLSATWQRLTTAERYGVVAFQAFLAGLRLLAGAGAALPVYGFMLGSNPNHPRPGLHAAVVLAVMLAGYALIYLTTPHDVTWHIISSVDRLLLQLWPTALLLFFLRVAALEERIGV